VIVALAPGANVPRLPVTMPPACVAEPTLDVAETKVNPAGRASVTTTSAAELVPLLFVTVSV
jgi:hypothetical protein